MDDHKIRIFIVDDHPMVIEGLRNMLQGAAGIWLAGYATTAASCIDFFREHEADVILMDINLPDGNGVDLCAKVKSLRPQVQILGLSTMDHPSTVKAMRESGASGYLLKSSSDTEIIRAIEVVSKGGEIWDTPIKHPDDKKVMLVRLTRREKEILAWLVEGIDTAEIAKKPGMNIATTGLHVKSLMEKYHVEHLAALIDAAKNKI